MINVINAFIHFIFLNMIIIYTTSFLIELIKENHFSIKNLILSSTGIAGIISFYVYHLSIK